MSDGIATQTSSGFLFYVRKTLYQPIIVALQSDYSFLYFTSHTGISSHVISYRNSQFSLLFISLISMLSHRPIFAFSISCVVSYFRKSVRISQTHKVGVVLKLDVLKW